MAHVGLAWLCNRTAEWRVLEESTLSCSVYIYCKAPQPGAGWTWTVQHSSHSSRRTWDNGNGWTSCQIILQCFWLENVAQQGRSIMPDSGITTCIRSIYYPRVKKVNGVFCFVCLFVLWLWWTSKHTVWPQVCLSASVFIAACLRME